ncbi:protoporphyrinogen oxidase [Peteryoungia desertarenae]|uniref:Protoporphyrinogen oxidase n=1 Tax=Peteryoungia desertarenae TaxID=1813451 RepID=A0ABX6QPX3_9HYPH|nr:flavodoxin domain-containing protein [Peteryoungia desertarenae]QLF70626.1 protoporphyrinogen oxidase [Peteryoungia desertarenae]
MIILVGYTSIEGQTKKIAEAIAARIEQAGDRALLFNIASMDEYAVGHPEAAILCAPIHAGRYPGAFTDFVARERPWLNSVPSAFVSVTLSIASDYDDERAEAEHFPEAMKAESGWKPAMIHHAAGALRFTQYDFFKRWMMKRIASHENAPTDTSRDHEFTDWTALASFTTDFLKAARP